MSVGSAFVIIWFAFTIATILAVIPVIVWAVRTKQFSAQDRARYLPLECSFPVLDEHHEEPPPCSN